MRSARTGIVAFVVVMLAALALFLAWNRSDRRIRTAQAQAGPGLATLETIRGPGRGLRVLFVGNSFTYYHDLPVMVTRLAEAAGEELPLLAMQETPGGCTLRQHWDNGVVGQLLHEARWDYVVLQEQSQLPSFSQRQRLQEIHPFARQLDAKIKEAGARTVLFMTWGRKAGDQENLPGDNYVAMQERLRGGYSDLAADLTATVAPVGLAWKRAVELRPDLDLWDADGIHPSPQGSYLAACVLYAVLYGRDSIESPFTAGLKASEAQFLQQMALASMGK